MKKQEVTMKKFAGTCKKLRETKQKMKELEKELYKELGKKFDKTQAYQIILGLASGVDVKIYMDPAYSPVKMALIRDYLENHPDQGQDVISRISPEKSYSEIYDIFKELHEAV